MSAYILEAITADDCGITHEDDAVRKNENDFDAAVEQTEHFILPLWKFGCMNLECWELHQMA